MSGRKGFHEAKAACGAKDTLRPRKLESNRFLKAKNCEEETSTTNRAGVRDPLAHSGHRRAHNLLGTVIRLFIPASVHCTPVVHLTSCLYCTADQ